MYFRYFINPSNMPNIYKSHPDARLYKRYSDEKLQQCLDDTATGKCSERNASAHYNIPRQTIRNKMKDVHCSTVGRQKVFSDEEEEAFVNHIACLANSSFPVTKSDLRFIIKGYLDKKRKAVNCFNNNCPGREWVSRFMKRYDEELREKFAHNMSKKRANVTENVVNDFFDNPEKEGGFAPGKIFNFDESGFSDDPGKKKMIFVRKIKHSQLICNSSKINYSAMFCSSANEELLPPYVVYKGSQPLIQWTQHGPPGARYAASKSGWFDQSLFENWFDTVLYPVLKRRTGKKLVICDNLTSHISLHVLSQCDKIDAKFICLLPNSTHLLQPLDVSVFSPLKTHWRSILHSWKQTKEGRKNATLPKHMFSELLKKLLAETASKLPENIQSGFQKTGIFPLTRQKVISSLPKFSCNDVQGLVGEAFKEFIENFRKDFTTSKITSRKRVQLSLAKA